MELVLSWLLGEALRSCVLACCTWGSATAKSLFLSNDHPYFMCCWYRLLFLSAMGPTGATVAEMLCLKGHEINNTVRVKHSILSKAKAVQTYFCSVKS